MLKINKLQTSLIIAIGLLIIGLIINYLFRLKSTTSIFLDMQEPTGIPYLIQMILLSLLIIAIICFCSGLIFKEKIKYKNFNKISASTVLLLFLLYIFVVSITRIISFANGSTLQIYSIIAMVFTFVFSIFTIVTIMLTYKLKNKTINLIFISLIFISIVGILIWHILVNIELINEDTIIMQNYINSGEIYGTLISQLQTSIDNFYCMNITYYIALGINLITFIAYLIKTFAKSITYK